MIEVGSRTFNPASFITRIGDDKPIIILLEEDYVLYLDPVDLIDLTTTRNTMSMWETPREPLSLLPSDDELEAPRHGSSHHKPMSRTFNLLLPIYPNLLHSPSTIETSSTIPFIPSHLICPINHHPQTCLPS